MPKKNQNESLTFKGKFVYFTLMYNNTFRLALLDLDCRNTRSSSTSLCIVPFFVTEEAAQIETCHKEVELFVVLRLYGLSQLQYVIELI